MRSTRRSKPPINLITHRCPNGHEWKSMLVVAKNCPRCRKAEQGATTARAGRALGLLSGEIESGRMSLGEALETAALSEDLCLDADDIDDVQRSLRERYAAPASHT